MRLHEAMLLLGFPGECVPTRSELKAAYRRLAGETHPDRFPAHQKAAAERKFKLISEAYTLLCSGARVRVVPHMVPGRRRLFVMSGSVVKASVPFIFLVMGAVTLGGSTAARAYAKQKEANSSYNPFLP